MKHSGCKQRAKHTVFLEMAPLLRLLISHWSAPLTLPKQSGVPAGQAGTCLFSSSRLLQPHSLEVNRSAIPSDTTAVTPDMSKECSHVCTAIVFQLAATRGRPSGKPDWSQINIPAVTFSKVSLRRALTSQCASRSSRDGSLTVGSRVRTSAVLSLPEVFGNIAHFFI